ncbi:tyrosine-type recombinase/integrase [Xenorhabdus sp. KJ12.1]|uniref:tyrosine-type recombinase/integrase n=2 Tax=Xenorhabdus sp. KJ12.1 TaxID=1851571 RepID=UPI0030DDDAE5
MMSNVIISDSVTNSFNITAYAKHQINPAVSYLLRLRSTKSQKTMRSCINCIVAIFGPGDFLSFDWTRLDKTMVQIIIQGLLKQNKAPRTINLMLCAVKGIAEEARSSRLIDSETYQDIKSVKRVSGSRVSKGRMLELHETQAIFQYLERIDSVMSIRDAAMFAVMLGCGLRRAEIAGLKYEDMDFGSSQILIRGKGNKERKNYMSDETKEQVLKWVNQVRGDHAGYLFNRIRRHGDVTGDRLTADAIGFIVNRVLNALNIKKFTPHDLRRTYASALLDNGEDMFTVKDALGHASVTTTQQYDKRGTKRLKEAAKKLTFK